MKDLYNNLVPVLSNSPAAQTAAQTGTAVDLQGYEGALVIVEPGTVTDGVTTPVLKESSDNTTFSAVAAADMQGAFVAAVTGTVQKVGYLGSKRYIRLDSTATGTTTGAVWGAMVIKGYARHDPAGATQTP